MKIAESWLREWVDPDLDSNALGHQLTMLGLEVDGVDVEGAGLDGVLVAEVLEVAKHPDADRLSVCKVRAGFPSRGSSRCHCARFVNVLWGTVTALGFPVEPDVKRI